MSKTRYLKLRADQGLVRIVDAYRPRFSLPGRPASRSYVVECLVLAGIEALATRGVGGAPDTAPDAERVSNLQQILTSLDEVRRQREAAVSTDPDVVAEEVQDQDDTGYPGPDEDGGSSDG